jgi:hypothetical protein
MEEATALKIEIDKDTAGVASLYDIYNWRKISPSADPERLLEKRSQKARRPKTSYRNSLKRKKKRRARRRSIQEQFASFRERWAGLTKKKF